MEYTMLNTSYCCHSLLPRGRGASGHVLNTCINYLHTSVFARGFATMWAFGPLVATCTWAFSPLSATWCLIEFCSLLIYLSHAPDVSIAPLFWVSRGRVSSLAGFSNRVEPQLHMSLY